MKLLYRLWNEITGVDAPCEREQTSITTEKARHEVELVAPEAEDPYQDHTHLPHCPEHFLFTKDCTACQEMRSAQPPLQHAPTRSFGFTDSVTTATLNPSRNSIMPTSPHAPLQTLPEMMLQAEAPYHSVTQTFIVNEVVDTVVGAVAEAEIDLIKDDSAL
jgi:hypothetical protein